MNSHNNKRVGIIGGSGFIGSYNTKKFLEEGYLVRVSSTDLSNESKYDHLKQLPNANNLEIVSLNVKDKNKLSKFVNGCQIVVHGGTPFQLDVEDPQKDLFEPTIKGTENFLEVINNTPGIEKVIVIASVAAFNTNFPLPPDGMQPQDKISESDTPFISQESHPYAQAKYLANEVVEKFVTSHPNLNYEVTSVSPVFVTGRSLSQREDSTSSGMQFLFKNNMAPNPFVQMMYDLDVHFAMVDVADVAESIYRAATTRGLHGKNYLLTSESFRISDISRMLNKISPKDTAQVIYQNDLARHDLGVHFKPVHSSLTTTF